jgi:hypothetical protein
MSYYNMTFHIFLIFDITNELLINQPNKMKKSLAILLFISLSLSSFAFKAILHISVTPSDAKIYIDNVLKGTGNLIITLDEAKEVQVRFEKEGYATQSYYYAYNVPKGTTSRKSYDRGDNYIVIELEKGDKVVKQEVVKEVITKNESSSSSDISMCKAQMVDGIYVFINSVPSQPYETAFQIETKVAGGFGCPSINDLAKAVVKSARKNGLPFDAVILGSGKIDLAIKFK